MRTNSTCPHCGKRLRFHKGREVLCSVCNEPVRLYSGLRETDVCPNCGTRVVLGGPPALLCMECNQPVRISSSYRRRISLMALLVVVVIGFATYGRASGGVWVVGLVLFWPLAAFVLSAIVQPIYERGYAQPHVTFVSIFLAVFASIFTVEFVILLFLHTILGAKPWETREQLFMLSEPMVFFSQQFLITPETNFVDACGLMLGNSFRSCFSKMARR